MSTYEMIVRIYNETKDRYIRENIELLFVIVDIAIEFLQSQETDDRKTLMNFLHALTVMFDYRAHHYDALFAECKTAFYECVNNTLLITSSFYYDIEIGRAHV